VQSLENICESHESMIEMIEKAMKNGYVPSGSMDEKLK
jgi:hypothetical protein